MIEDLEKTDDYLNLYLPFRIQKMIDDTLFTVTTNIEFKRLLEYEQTTFKNLMTNVKTLSSKLVKDECLVPSQEDRERVQRERNHQRCVLHTLTRIYHERLPDDVRIGRHRLFWR